MNKNSVVQFTENHKWCGCLGVIEEVTKCGDDVRYMIGIPIPLQGTAFVFAMKSKNEIEYIGEAAFIRNVSNDK